MAVVAAVGIPLVAFLVVDRAVHGHAKYSYFEVVAQILPVLVLALVIEQRYLNPRWKRLNVPAKFEKQAKRMETSMMVFVSVYGLIVLGYLVWGEFVALEVLAAGHSTESNLKATSGSMAAGATALVITALFRSGHSGSVGQSA